MFYFLWSPTRSIVRVVTTAVGPQGYHRRVECSAAPLYSQFYVAPSPCLAEAFRFFGFLRSIIHGIVIGCGSGGSDVVIGCGCGGSGVTAAANAARDVIVKFYKRPSATRTRRTLLHFDQPFNDAFLVKRMGTFGIARCDDGVTLLIVTEADGTFIGDLVRILGSG